MAGRKKSVAESPIADVFEGRHPSTAEKEWAEKTLAPALEKSPEKPIGAATGTKDRKSTRLNSSHIQKSRMPSSA